MEPDHERQRLRTRHPLGGSEQRRVLPAVSDLRVIYISQDDWGWVSSTCTLSSVHLHVLIRYGLAWNPIKAGHVLQLGVSEDMTVRHWQSHNRLVFPNLTGSTRIQRESPLSSLSMSKEVTRSLSVYMLSGLPLHVTYFITPRQDVDWQATKENILTSIGNNKCLMMCAPLLSHFRILFGTAL